MRQIGTVLKNTVNDGELISLAYELLDAHLDTAQLAGDLEVDSHWSAHLGYLRDLQRVGREALARASTGGNLQGPGPAGR